MVAAVGIDSMDNPKSVQQKVESDTVLSRHLT